MPDIKRMVGGVEFQTEGANQAKAEVYNKGTFRELHMASYSLGTVSVCWGRGCITRDKAAETEGTQKPELRNLDFAL